MNEKINKSKTVMELAHKAMQSKFERNGEDSDRYVTDNRLISLLSLYPDAGPRTLSDLLRQNYGIRMSPSEIITNLKAVFLGNPQEREPLFRWAGEMAKVFKKAAEGDYQSFEQFYRQKSAVPAKTGAKRRAQERILVISLYTLLAGMDECRDLESLMYMGNTKARYCLYDLEDAISKAYGFSVGKSKVKKEEKNGATQKLTYAQALQQIEELEAVIQRTNALLKDLQDEFEEQIEESRVQELTEFFSRLNSDSYGRILDELFLLRKGIKTLRAEHYELPEAINGLMIMATKLLQFTKDSHIDPIMRINTVQEVKASDIEFCIYEGTPFTDKNEVKRVRVISPGWIFRDKDIQISKPRLKEEK